jgi:hypothetical protein
MSSRSNKCIFNDKHETMLPSMHLRKLSTDSLLFLFLWLAAHITTAQSTGFRGSPKSRKLIQGFISNFPSVTRDLHPEALQLKAHGSIHMGEKDPEIFAALEAVLTPYFSDIIGESLVAYDLEIVYSEGEDPEVEGIIVTNMLVKCIITVRSDSVEALRLHTHEQADEWFYDFFDGLNVFKFLANLHDIDIDVNEIVFQDEEFKSPLLNGGEVISEVNSNGISSGSSVQKPSGSGGQGGAIAGAFVGVLVVCGVLLVRYKEKIPWHLVQDMTLGSETSLEDSDLSGNGKPSKGRRLSDAIKKKLPSSQAIKKKLPSSDAIKQKLPSSDAIKQKFPSSVRRAALQKKPASSTDYPEPKQETKKPLLLNSNPYNPFNNNDPPSDISFSIEGDYNIPDEYDFSVRSPTISSYSGQGRAMTPVHGLGSTTDEEFSMPDDYNTVNDDYSVHCHSILGLVDQTLLVDDRSRTHLVPASPYYNELDEWSVDGYSEGYSHAAAANAGGAKSGLDLPPLP